MKMNLANAYNETIGINAQQDGLQQALTAEYKEIYREAIWNNPQHYFSHLDTETIDYLTKRATNRKKCKRYRYVFMTINPLPRVTLAMMQSRMSKTLNKKWIENYIYCYEQRSETFKDMGNGKHIHILFTLRQTKSPWQCKSEVYNTWKDHVGSMRSIDHKYANYPDNFVNYIKGIKKGSTKDLKHKVDLRWRASVGLQDIYVKPDPITS